MTLSWQAPTSDGGASISGYRVYRDGAELVTLGEVLTHTDTSAVPGTTYAYTVTALNAAGESPPSNEASATPLLPTLEIPGVQGDWVDTYGADGYALFAWTASSDLKLLPPASLAIEQGARSAVGVVTDVRALERPDQAERRVGALYHASQVRLRLTFPAAYDGTLHLYAVDWATTARRQRFTIDDGSGPRVAAINTNFHDGAWLHFPVSVNAGGALTIRVDRLAGANVVLNGLFLGEGPPPAPPAPQVASAPRNLAATPGEARVTLSWQAPTSDGGASISGYRVYRDGDELVTLGEVLTHTDTSAVPGTTYAYTVTALNAAGESPPSNEASATPLLPTLEIPGVQGDWVDTYGARRLRPVRLERRQRPETAAAGQPGHRAGRPAARTGSSPTCAPSSVPTRPSGASARSTTPARSGCG